MKSPLYILAILLCITIQLSSQASVEFPQSVITKMASREMRYHHYLWHNVRDSWNLLSSSAKKELTKLGWDCPRPARITINGVYTQILDNDSGEDFLYMHRWMIGMANDIIAANKEPYGNITGWTSFPAPGDLEFPVPPAYNITGNPSTTSGTTTRKKDSFYNETIKPYEETFKDPEQLRNMTLGQLGSRIEATVHAYAHMRWSNNSSYGYRPSVSGTIPNFDAKWDNPQYNWLGDTYASQVHPWFWKIHGWVDDRIEDWRKANNLEKITWKGTWIGGNMANITQAKTNPATTTGMKMKSASVTKSATASVTVNQDSMAMMSIENMEKAMEIVLSEVDEVSFADDVAVDDFVPEEYKYKPVSSEGKKCRRKKSKSLRIF